VDRADTRDMVLLRKGVGDRILLGEKLRIGTCSPRREEMALHFLAKALPQFSKEIQIESKPIRGNVETRVRKLLAGDFDAIILATAGVNRLLEYFGRDSDFAGYFKYPDPLIRTIYLPLTDCVPAPSQGAVVAETLPDNDFAIQILNEINDKSLMNDCLAEKRIARGFGTGCDQRFGVTTIRYGEKKTVYAAGRDVQGNSFSQFYDLPEIPRSDLTWFSSTDHMRDFYEYDYFDLPGIIEEPVVYIANYKSLQKPGWAELLKGKRVWVAGTKTWFSVSRLGIWVEGSADALGMETLTDIWKLPTIGIDKQDVCVLTHEGAARRWKEKGWKTRETHQLKPVYRPEIAAQIREANAYFWTSAGQYEIYQADVNQKALHACPFGETAELLREKGLNPLVFPTIKSFSQWRES